MWQLENHRTEFSCIRYRRLERRIKEVIGKFALVQEKTEELETQYEMLRITSENTLAIK